MSKDTGKKCRICQDPIDYGDMCDDCKSRTDSLLRDLGKLPKDDKKKKK